MEELVKWIEIIFIVFFILGFLLLINKYRKKYIRKDIDEIALTNAIKNKVLTIIEDKDRFQSIQVVSFNVFKEFHTENIYEEIFYGIKNDGHKYLECNEIDIDIDKASEIIKKELSSVLVINKLSVYYYELNKNIQENIKQAEVLEQEAIEYHATFGNEPDGDPILHPKEANSDNDTSDDNKTVSINDLISTGTVEDIDE